MTSNKNMFTHFDEIDCGHVRFGDNATGRIIGKGTIGANPKIEDVAFVEGLKFNLLSVNQLCDKGTEVRFKRKKCLVRKEEMEMFH